MVQKFINTKYPSPRIITISQKRKKNICTPLFKNEFHLIYFTHSPQYMIQPIEYLHLLILVFPRIENLHKVFSSNEAWIGVVGLNRHTCAIRVGLASRSISVTKWVHRLLWAHHHHLLLLLKHECVLLVIHTSHLHGWRCSYCIWCVKRVMHHLWGHRSLFPWIVACVLVISSDCIVV